MVPQWIIEKKRDGQALSKDEIQDFITGYVADEIPDYQMAAIAMAIYLNGMTPREIADLTTSMMNSGDLVDTSSIQMPKVDKHSTGGIGDKVSLILAPLIASCGAAVPMISGRGLGITGGTLDKLESIPGYRTDLSETDFISIIQTCGCSIMGQTGQIAPADKKLYALRDVTATVPSIPLITASIMCKKMAEGIDALVLDVKWGRGAFMKTIEDARALAQSMVNVGHAMDKDVSAILTDMNKPLGRTVGNSLEVLESVQALRGEGPDDLMTVTMALARHMLLATGLECDPGKADALLRNKISSGQALETFQKMIQLHHGNPAVCDKPENILPQASLTIDLPTPDAGYIHDVNAEAVGKAALLLGAGRTKTTDQVNPAVGLSEIRQHGDWVEKNEPLAVIHADVNDARTAEALELLNSAFIIKQEEPTPGTLIFDTIDQPQHEDSNHE